ncbi:MAG: ABC transporter ATP-binding protein [Chloroflexi bacterium]|nr:ABC transporter ATP-binding protein [Chloroflexota bacterium]
MLEIVDLQARYGSIRALSGVSLRVEASEVVALLGANGAGKSTLLKTVAGVVPPAAGRVVFRGREITGAAGHRIVGLGLVRIPEGRSILKRMTVTENLVMGAYLRRDGEIESDAEGVFDRFPRLAERRTQVAGSLSGGEQQMLALGRALMARPKLLMMDEPSLGLAPVLVKETFRLIAELRRTGLTILLVEQNAREALRVADRGYVLETGQIVVSGPSVELGANPRVQAAYLGG